MNKKFENSMCLERTFRFKGERGFRRLELLEEEATLKGLSINDVVMQLIDEHQTKFLKPINDANESACCDMPDCTSVEVVGQGFWLLNNAGLRNLCLRHYFEARDLQDRRQGMAWRNLEWTYQGKHKLCHYAAGNRFYRGCEAWASGKVRNVVSGEVFDVCLKCLDARRGCRDKWQILKEEAVEVV